MDPLQASIYFTLKTAMQIIIYKLFISYKTRIMP